MLNDCSQLSGNMLDTISTLVGLKQLGLARWPTIYTKDLEVLKRLKSIELLDLSGCMNIHFLTEIIPCISPCLLNTIILEDVSDMNDLLLDVILKHCPRLTTLNLNYSGPVSLLVLFDIPQTYKEMKHLYLAAQPAVDDSLIEEISAHCSKLITLDISYTGIFGHSFKLRPFPMLENLFLNGCSNIQSPDTVRLIQACCPKLTTLQILNTTILDITKDEEDEPEIVADPEIVDS